MKEKFRFIKFFDYQLFFAILVLSIIGLIAIYATGERAYFVKQIFSLLVSLLLFLVIIFIDYRNYKKFAEIFYGLIIFLLLIVINMGYEAFGAQRWLSLFGISIQPSEITKLGLIITLAKFLEMRQAKLNSLLEIIPSFVLIGIPFLIIFKQPDLGTAIVLVIIFSVMSLWAGMRAFRLFLLASPLVSIMVLYLIPFYPFWTWTIYLTIIFIFLMIKKVNFLDAAVLFSMNVLAGVFSPLLWQNLAEYQQNRLLSFLNPALDPLARGVRYHTVKSVIAVGSGGWFGKGFLKGPLTQLHYIPQQHTDFIFSVIGEQFGLLGALLVLGLFLFVIYRLLTIAFDARTMFGALIVVGIATMFFFQVFVNIGMNIGIMPVVGLPLPFLSAGGTSLIVSWLAIAIVQSVNMRKGTLAF